MNVKHKRSSRNNRHSRQQRTRLPTYLTRLDYRRLIMIMTTLASRARPFHRLMVLLGCLMTSNGFLMQPRPSVDRGRQHVLLYQQGKCQSESLEFEDTRATTSRREWLTTMGIVSSTMLLPLSAIADDVDEKEDEKEGLVSTKRIADLLRAVPTFAIVDQKGVPYMVVGEDAKVTGYFFTDYQEAKRILTVADKSADKAIAKAKKEDPAQAADFINPWKEARISTVPMDFVVTLITKSLNDRRSGGNYFQIAPSAQDIENALAVTGKEDLAEGKVPLFYYEDFTLPVSSSDGPSSSLTNPQTPLYFQQKQLEDLPDYVKSQKLAEILFCCVNF